MKLLTEFASWIELQKHASDIRLLPASDLDSLSRANNPFYKKNIGCLTYNFSRQRINPDIFKSLMNLAIETELEEKINLLMSGAKVNISENKAALHTALRELNTKPLIVDGINVMQQVIDTREKMKVIAELVRTKKWPGYSGKIVTDVVNIGIGGSDLGPRFCVNALAELCSKEINYHFISDIDPDSYEQVIRCIDPQTTLFIISSKSFTTKETLLNAGKALKLYPSEQDYAPHFIAVTAHPERATRMGIKTVLPIWDWVGGRYSFCSAVNLITAIAIGFELFMDLLSGANAIDKHVQHTEFKNNIPVLMALFGVWNNNFLNIHNLLLLAYSKKLEYFIPYCQQLDMESNGKSIDINGRVVHYATGPIVWGGLGNQAQHSYFQLLCQGTHKHAVDFITLQTNEDQMINSMCEYKMRVLSEGVHVHEHPNGYIPGNIPLNHIELSESSPYTLGALVALYEHKIFIQSVIWNINPFEQPGVESAKLQGNLVALI